MATEDPDDIDINQDSTTELNEAFASYHADIDDAANGGEAMRIAIDAATEFAKIQANAPDDMQDTIETLAEPLLNDLSDMNDSLSRKNVRGIWEDEIASAKKRVALETGERKLFEDEVREKLTSVTKKRTTDHDGTGTTYTLEFEGGVTLSVPHGALMDERRLWDRYTSKQQDNYPILSGDDEAEEFTAGDDENSWSNVMGEIIEDVGEDVEVEVGPRTSAVKQLENHVKTSVARPSLRDTVEHGGVWVVEGDVVERDGQWVVEPDDDGTAVIGVLREDVASITNRQEISDRALQEELGARELTGSTLPGNKVSKGHTVAGQWQTVWHLDGDHFDSLGGFDDGDGDAMDRMPDREDEGEDDGNTDTVSGESERVNDDDEDNEPGVIGSTSDDDDPLDRMPDRDNHDSEDEDEDESDEDTDDEDTDDEDTDSNGGNN